MSSETPSVASVSAAAAPSREDEFDIVIIGAGFSGLGMLKRARDAGFSACVFETADDVGGTWYWNRYPGACCDSESIVYSFSFDDNLLDEWEWKSRYPSQSEVLGYLGHVADKFDLRRDIRLETRVTAATVDTDSGMWTIETDSGEKVTSRYLITAVGCLSASQLPDIPRIDSFEGVHHHTGQWPHEGVDFTGQRVAVIGTGSTGIQIIPEIAKEAEHLWVFQRTPNFSMPARNRPLTDAERERFKRDFHAIREEAKHTPTGNLFYLDERSTFDVDERERQEWFKAGWEAGGLKLLFAGYHDLLTNEEANRTAADFVRGKIAEIVMDPATAEKLMPRDHPLGTKRPPIDTGYFETYNRPNVSLVDLRETPIKEITPTGIRTAAEDFELDAIVFATGFDAMTGALSKIDIRTEDGIRLADKWADGPQTYLGLMSAGFPNLFTITGPGSPSVLSNMPVSIEQHIEFIGDLIDHLQAHGLTRVEAAVEAEAEWTEFVDQLASETLMPRANSWYMGANTPGKPHRFLPYVGGVGEYRERCAQIAADGYPGFTFANANAVAEVKS